MSISGSYDAAQAANAKLLRSGDGLTLGEGRAVVHDLIEATYQAGDVFPPNVESAAIMHGMAYNIARMYEVAAADTRAAKRDALRSVRRSLGRFLEGRPLWVEDRRA